MRQAITVLSLLAVIATALVSVLSAIITLIWGLLAAVIAAAVIAILVKDKDDGYLNPETSEQTDDQDKKPP